MALYGDFIAKRQNQVYLLDSVERQSVACYEPLYKTTRWPEALCRFCYNGFY